MAGVLTTGFVAYAFNQDRDERAELADLYVSNMIDHQYQQVAHRGW
jgi:hypothetical protein